MNAFLKKALLQKEMIRVVYNEIQSAIFGQNDVLALKKNLREFIESKSTYVKSSVSIPAKPPTASKSSEIAAELTDIVWMGKVARATRKGIGMFIEKKNLVIQREQESLKVEQEKLKGEQDAKKIAAVQKALEKAQKAIGEVEERVKTQNEFAIISLNQTIQRLKDNHYQDVARILIDLYPIVLPYLIKGQDESPTHHIAHVVNFMSEILLGEVDKSISPENVKRGMIAALLHDIGVGDAIFPKITENMVKNETDPKKKEALRTAAMESRKEHMEKGVEISREILEEYNKTEEGKTFAPEDVETILNIVGKHDNSKIPLMMVGEYGDSMIPEAVLVECRKYLLTSDKSDWLMQLHWEADALWMLSSDGLLVDLKRQGEADTPQNRLAKLRYNLGLHSEVVTKVYEKVYSVDEFKKLNFHKDLLYRSQTGYDIARRLVAEGELSLANENFDSALSRISKAKGLIDDQKNELKHMLTTLFERTLPYFTKGVVSNPLYHNTQVLDNMVQIGLGENLPFRELKNALIVALLHDIGNAISEAVKVTKEQIKAAKNAGDEQGAAHLKKLYEDFRSEHMARGPELVREVLKELTESKVVLEEDVSLICEAVKIHDNPSIGLPFEFDNSPRAKMITVLREADRLFMVSYQGVVKDLMSDNKDINPENIKTKLASNMKKHTEEYKLYVDKGSPYVVGFQHGTLYRTPTGYGIFDNASKEIEKEIKKEIGNAAPTLTPAPEALVKQLLSNGKISIASEDGEQFAFTYKTFGASWLDRAWGILALEAIEGKNISKTYFHFRMDRNEKIAYIDTSYEWTVGRDIDEPPDAYHYEDDWDNFTITNSDTIYHAINVSDEVKRKFRGVGAALMSIGLAIAKEKGMDKVILREHTYVPEFYEKIGFSINRGVGGRGESGEFDLIKSTIPAVTIKRKEDTMARISEDLPVRAQIFKANLTRILAEHPDQFFFMGIETNILELQHASIMPIFKAVDEIKELKDRNGRPLFPNLMVRREKAEELVKMVSSLVVEGKLNLNSAFIGARKFSVDGKLYDSIKGEGRAWISAIDDSNEGSYLPVFEAITLNMMAYLSADTAAIKNFYDAISDKPVEPAVLEDMIRNRLIYILPRAIKFDVKQLRELYELAQQVYVAA